MNFLTVKIVFVLAIVDPTPTPMFLWTCWFLWVGAMRMGSGLAAWRLDGLASSPNATPLGHARNIAFVAALLGANAAAVTGALSSITNSKSGPSISTVLFVLYDPAHVAIEAMHTLSRASLVLSESRCLRLGGGSGCDVAAIRERHIDFAVEMLSGALTLLHYVYIAALHYFKVCLSRTRPHSHAHAHAHAHPHAHAPPSPSHFLTPPQEARIDIRIYRR